MLSNYGQTVGKKVLDIKIVGMDGNKLEFLPLIGLRYAPLWIASYVPVVGGILAIVNILFIFRKDRRCIHDHIAGTQVVESTTITLNDNSTENPF